MPPSELDTLLRALRDRDIPFGEDDVAWAFEEAATRDSVVSWTQEHLQPCTLLTKAELDFYERHGLGPATPEPSSGRPLTEDELESAIASLEASTAAIEKQSAILESQKRALQDIQARNVTNVSAATIQDTRQRKITREKAQLDFEVDDILQTTTERLKSSSKLADTAISNISAQVERTLEKDDRLLDGLQKLLPKIAHLAQEGQDAASIEQLCSALTALSILEFRARLDRSYREAVQEHQSQQNGSARHDISAQQAKQRDNLRAELEELGGEVEGLVGIVVDHQYRKPLKQGMSSAQTDLQAQRSNWCDYTISALTYLVARLDVINDHIHRIHNHGDALRAVSTTLDNTLAAAQKTRAGASNNAPSPGAYRRGSRGLRTLRLVEANLEGQDPAVQLLRQQELRVSDTSSAAEMLQTVSSTIRERRERVSALSSATEQGTTHAIVQSLAGAETTIQQVHGALFALSRTASVQLVDPDVKAGLDELERETQRLSEEMRELDVDAVSRAVVAKQRELVQKLSSQG